MNKPEALKLSEFLHFSGLQKYKNMPWVGLAKSGLINFNLCA